MAKNTSNGIREFVKNSLNQYYKNFQAKLADNPQPTDINPTIKMVNDGSVYVYDIGSYDGISIQNASTLQKVINSAENDIVAIKNDINILENNIQDLSTHSIKNIDAGNNIKVEKLSKTTAKISAIGYFYNEWKKSFVEGPDGLNQANGLNSHAEGQATIADGDFAHAEGITTQAKIYAHAEGHTTKAFGEASHAEGNLTQALGNHSHTEGNQTMANGFMQKANLQLHLVILHMLKVCVHKQQVQHAMQKVLNQLQVLKIHTPKVLRHKQLDTLPMLKATIQLHLDLPPMQRVSKVKQKMKIRMQKVMVVLQMV